MVLQEFFEMGDDDCTFAICLSCGARRTKEKYFSHLVDHLREQHQDLYNKWMKKRSKLEGSMLSIAQPFEGF